MLITWPVEMLAACFCDEVLYTYIGILAHHFAGGKCVSESARPEPGEMVYRGNEGEGFKATAVERASEATSEPKRDEERAFR